MGDVTQILEAARKSDPQAAHQLLPLVYEELRKLAVVRMANKKPGQTLQRRFGQAAAAELTTVGG
ncbi:MAG TPA: ECF-type sigma factor [Verrucomicrobiae bacterium]|nr:ECF-type sigma factor [Verrucomicrobiae bacterium]